MHKEFRYEGSDRKAIVDQIDTLPFHRNNLRIFGRTRFKDIHGATHKWKLVKDNESEQSMEK